MTKALKILLGLATVVFVFTVSGCSSQPTLSEDQSWYAFNPTNTYEQQSKIGLEDWSPGAAGQYGRIEAREDKLFYNNQEFKLWGLNNCYWDCAPPKELAEKRASFYKKFGVNAMRLHKYADKPAPMGLQTAGSFVGMDSAYLDRMDYFVKVLKDKGIFTKLSPTFGVKFGPDDIDRIPFHKEVGSFSENKNRLRATYGAVYLSKELQDLQIEQTLAVLKHKNPYTQLTYAKDPAIFCVELFNEDAILWFGANWTLQRYPTLRKRTAKAFSQWLLQKIW